MSVALRSYQSVAHDRIFEEFDKGIRSTLLVLPTGCVAGDTVIGVNRCGKGYSRTIADAYRLQSHPRVNHEYLTRVRSHVGDRIGLHPIKGIVYSGMKTVCDLRLEDGKSIRTTPDHEIMAESGWVALGDLAEGDRVACESDPPVDRPRKPKLQYVVVQGLVNHPYAMGVTSRTRTGRKPEGRLYRVARHRLVAEAEANGMTFEEMVSICRSDPVRASSLTFFDPSDYAVHHDDRNHRNNVGPNLKVLTHEDHARLHGKTDTLANFGCGLIGYSRVISVKTIGVQATYDIVCEDPHRNFVGNGIVVHNCGKTITFGAVARDVIHSGQGRVLVLAHRGELLDQAADSLAALDVETAIEKAERSARGSLFGDPDCVVASVQTMQRARLQSWPRKHFKLVVTDESHHAISDSYQNIYKHLDPDWHLGVTATADRLDGENLGQVYQSVAFEYSLRQAIEEGWLARLKVVRCDTEVDLSAIRTTGGDMNAGDLEDAIRPHVEELANATRQEIGDRRAIVFTPDVGSADAFASALTSLGIRSESIAGDSRDRAEIIDGFRKGRSRVLCNCNLLTEGFDAPFVSAIVLARPTKSRSLFSQMVGRGTRRAHGKDDCLIVDFDWKQLTGKHALISPVELFDTTKMDAEVQDLARRMVESGESPDLMDAIERAEATHAERVKIRVKARERESRYRRVAYDPFAVMDTLGIASRAEAESSLRVKPTDRQIATLEKLGVTDARSMSRRRASQMLDVLFSRMDRKLATLKQISHLISNGIDPDEARAMTKDEASARLDVLFGKAVAR